VNDHANRDGRYRKIALTSDRIIAILEVRGSHPWATGGVDVENISHFDHWAR